MTASYAEFSPALPRALEGLSPRERILWSMARVVAEEGFESVTVTGVVRRAGVSRETFNELFEDKKECVLAAHARVIDGFVAHVSRAFEGHGPWPQKIRRGLAACLEEFSAEPKVARMAISTFLRPGPKPGAAIAVRWSGSGSSSGRAASTRSPTPCRPTPS